MSDGIRNTGDARNIKIAQELAGGPEAWADLPEDDRARLLQEVEDTRAALADPEAPDDADSDEVIIETVRRLHEAQINNFIEFAESGLFAASIAQNARYSVNSVLRAAENLGKISPYYEALIEKKPEYKALRNAHASVTLKPKDDAPEDVKALHELFKAAWAEAREQWEQDEAAIERGDIPKNVQAKRLKVWKNPTDKNSALFFSAAMPGPQDIPGQFSFIPKEFTLDNSIPINNGKTGRTKSGKASKSAILYLTYQTDAATMQSLHKKWGDDYATNFFVTFAAANLFLEGNRQITLSQLFRAMPGKTNGNPSTNQLKELFKSVLQCISTTVYINTKEVSERWGIDRYKEIISPVLPAKWINERLTINGALAESYLEMYDITPFLHIARDMKQIQPVNMKVLEIKISRTEMTYRVLYYLLRQVLWMQNKNGGRSNVITYADMYDAVNATKRQREAVRNHCYKILEQWREIGFISGYKETETGAVPGVVIDSRKDEQKLLID